MVPALAEILAIRFLLTCLTIILSATIELTAFLGLRGHLGRDYRVSLLAGAPDRSPPGRRRDLLDRLLRLTWCAPDEARERLIDTV